MIGKISLIKVEKKVMPAVCIDKTDKSFLYLQLAPANEEDKFNSLDFKTRMKRNKGKPENRQKKIIHASKIKRYYIGVLEGLKNESSVLLDRQFIITEKNIVKELANLPQDKLKKIIVSYKEYHHFKQLRNEMYLLKQEIEISKLNNTPYIKEEQRLTQILSELKFPPGRIKFKRPFENYREVPNKSGIRVFRG